MAALDDYEEKMVEGLPTDSSEKRALIRGIAAEEPLVYEIIWLCLVITLTRLHDPLKIGGRSTHKRKDDQRTLCFDRHEKLLIANPSARKA
jgi:hypothetical protein